MQKSVDTPQAVVSSFQFGIFIKVITTREADNARKKAL